MSVWLLFWKPVQFSNADNDPHIQSSHRMSSVINPRHRQLSSSLEQHPPLKEPQLSKHNCQSTDTKGPAKGSQTDLTSISRCSSKPPMSRTAVISSGWCVRQTAQALLVSQWVQALGESPEPRGDLLHTHPAFPLKRSGSPQPRADLPEDGTWDGNTLCTEAEVKPLCLSPSQGLQLGQQTHVGVLLPLLLPDTGTRDRGALGHPAGLGSRPVSITTLGCAALKAQLAAAASPVQTQLRSNGTRLPRTRAPFGKCSSVVRLLHALSTARTACSSDTDHSFVLGIVLDSCNRSEHASASAFSTWMQRVLPHFTPCTHSKEILLPRAGPQSSPDTGTARAGSLLRAGVTAPCPPHPSGQTPAASQPVSPLLKSSQ